VTTKAAARDVIRAALVLRTHGVEGELRVEPLGGDAARFAPGLALYVEETRRRLTVAASRSAGRHVLLRLAEVNDAGEAAPLRGAYLCVDAADVRPLGDDEWFVWQLVGLRASTPSDRELGTVVDIEPGVANDVLVVETPAGLQRYPMVRDFIRSVDLAASRITLQPWEEMEDGR